MFFYFVINGRGGGDDRLFSLLSFGSWFVLRFGVVRG